jgi:hypothetical protein
VDGQVLVAGTGSGSVIPAAHREWRPRPRNPAGLDRRRRRSRPSRSMPRPGGSWRDFADAPMSV